MKLHYSKIVILQLVLFLVLIGLFFNYILMHYKFMALLTGSSCLMWMIIIAITINQIEKNNDNRRK